MVFSIKVWEFHAHQRTFLSEFYNMKICFYKKLFSQKMLFLITLQKVKHKIQKICFQTFDGISTLIPPELRLINPWCINFYYLHSLLFMFCNLQISAYFPKYIDTEPWSMLRRVYILYLRSERNLSRVGANLTIGPGLFV